MKCWCFVEFDIGYILREEESVFKKMNEPSAYAL